MISGLDSCDVPVAADCSQWIFLILPAQYAPGYYPQNMLQLQTDQLQIMVQPPTLVQWAVSEPATLPQEPSTAATSEASEAQEAPASEASEAPEAPSTQRLSTSQARRMRRKRAEARRAAWAESQQASYDEPPAEYVTDEAEETNEVATLRSKLLNSDQAGISKVIQQLKGHVVRLSFEADGCRLIQDALEVASPQQAADLVQELHGHVRDAATSAHANFVLQKILTQLNVRLSSFIAQELIGDSRRIACHRFGCRILCRIVEFCSSGDAAFRLFDEILQVASELCCHSFGQHVIQSLLEHGHARYQKAVANVLISDLWHYATHQNASYLVEKALIFCSSEERQAILLELGQPDCIVELAFKRFGSYVARTLIQQPEIDGEAAKTLIGGQIQSLLRTRHGQKFLEELRLVSPETS